MYLSKRKMEQEIISFLGGRAAEYLVMKDITTGASNDIERATQMARGMVTQYGMSDMLGPIQFGEKEGEVFLGKELGHSRNYSEKVAYTIDEEVSKIMNHSYQEALRILQEHMDVLHESSRLLMEKEKLTGEEFRALFIKNKAVDGSCENESEVKIGLEPQAE